MKIKAADGRWKVRRNSAGFAVQPVCFATAPRPFAAAILFFCVLLREKARGRPARADWTKQKRTTKQAWLWLSSWLARFRCLSDAQLEGNKLSSALNNLDTAVVWIRLVKSETRTCLDAKWRQPFNLTELKKEMARLLLSSACIC